jgi:hypothetical protein
MAICDLHEFPQPVEDHEFFAHLWRWHPDQWAKIADNRLVGDPDALAAQLTEAARFLESHGAGPEYGHGMVARCNAIAVMYIAAASLQARAF